MKTMITMILVSLCAHDVRAMDRGTATSGGGGAYVRRESGDTSPVVSAILVDIWESRSVAFAWPNGVGTLDVGDDAGGANPEDLVEQALAKLKRADAALAEQVRADYNYVRSNVRIIPADMRIEVPDDLRTPYFPVGHRTEGMMRFDGLTGKLDIDSEIFGHLITSKHVAGAWLHEAIYKTMRDSTFGHTTSIATRHLNACLLSNDPSCLPSTRQRAPQDRWIQQCETADFKFAIYPLSTTVPYYPAGYRVQFAKFGGLFGTTVYQDIAPTQILFNTDGTMTGASSGKLVSAFKFYDYSAGTAVIELKLSAQGELLGAVIRSARSSLRGGTDLLKTGSETATCKTIQGGIL